MVRPKGGEGNGAAATNGRSMARAPPGLMGALLLLLLLSSACAAPPPPSAAPPPSGPLGRVRGFLGQVGSAAGTLLGGLQIPAAPTRIRAAYEQGVTAAVTYGGILTDQIYHWWQGEQ